MNFDYSGPKDVAGGPRRGTSGDQWGTAYHRTRAEYVPSILRDGLEIGGEHRGAMTWVKDPSSHWPNTAYGCHPVFVFLRPECPENHSWETYDGNDVELVWLEVDVRGLAPYGDLWNLRDETAACAGATGFWWGRIWDVAEADAAPPLLQPFLNEEAIVTYEALFDEAAAAAIETSSSAAILEPVAAVRIRQLS